MSGMLMPCWYGAFGVMEFRFGYDEDSLTSENGSCTLTVLLLRDRKDES